MHDHRAPHTASAYGEWQSALGRVGG